MKASIRTVAAVTVCITICSRVALRVTTAAIVYHFPGLPVDWPSCAEDIRAFDSAYLRRHPAGKGDIRCKSSVSPCKSSKYLAESNSCTLI